MEYIGLVLPSTFIQRNVLAKSVFFNFLCNKKVSYEMNGCFIKYGKEDFMLSEKFRSGRIDSRLNKMTLPVHLPEEDIRGYLAQQENKRIVQMILASKSD